MPGYAQRERMESLRQVQTQGVGYPDSDKHHLHGEKRGSHVSERPRNKKKAATCGSDTETGAGRANQQKHHAYDDQDNAHPANTTRRGNVSHEGALRPAHRPPVRFHRRQGLLPRVPGALQAVAVEGELRELGQARERRRDEREAPVAPGG